MIKDNKYALTYYRLIDKRRNEKTEVGEKHHIIPKSLGGTNDSSNLVMLTCREHFIAHLLLTKMAEDTNELIKLSWALHRMSFSTTGSRAYEMNRKRFSNFLKNDFHPNRNNDSVYREKLSNIVEEHWKNNDDRRRKTSERMSKTNDEWKHRDPEGYFEHQRKSAKKGGEASRAANATRLEYNGKDYLGFNELKRKTGITKHLYQKYYLNGIDPKFRINSNGPLPKEFL